MEDYMKRVIDEEAQLHEKVEKLNAFINGNENYQALDLTDQTLLARQLTIMKEYLDILNKRIARFNLEE